MMTSKEIVLNAMRSLGRADAENLLLRIPDMTDTEIINEEEKIPRYDNGKDYSGYTANVFCVRDEDQVWVLLQPYNASHYPNTRPSGLRAMWGLKHTKNPLKAKPYVAPHGTSGLYMKDECYIDDDGAIWISLVDNNPYSAEEYPQNWKKPEEENDPA